MIPKQTGRRRGSLARITANVEFSSSGDLKTILLNAENDGDQETLERALYRLLKPDHAGWFQRLLRRS